MAVGVRLSGGKQQLIWERSYRSAYVIHYVNSSTNDGYYYGDVLLTRHNSDLSNVGAENCRSEAV